MDGDRTVFSPTKMAIFWIFLAAPGMGVGIFKGAPGMRVAVWIPGNRHRLTRQASGVRWLMVAMGALMIWQGWQLTMSAAADVLLVVVGSLMEIVFLYIPDAAFHVSSGFDRLLRRSTQP